MELITTTPFGQRPMTAALVKRAMDARAAVSVPHTDKWALLRDLTEGRHAFGITDRDLVVMNALLSFHQGNTLSDNESLVVFPSNKSLSDRAHGMAESTLRRHLAALVHAGLIQRHDSPNGKRYAARGPGGDVVRAFGFDLRPLLVSAAQIADAAQTARAAADQLRRLRETVVVTKRDALKLCQYGQDAGIAADWAGIEARLLGLHKALRRKQDLETLEALLREATAVLKDVSKYLKTDIMGGNARENERHHQNSNTDSTDLELCQESKARAADDAQETATDEPDLPLGLVLKACPDILPYANDEIRHWHQLVAAAGLVRSMMGISQSAWEDARIEMGSNIAAITVVAILQRISDIKSPGGYLRSLTRKSANGAFSPGPMVMALLKQGIG